MTLFEEIEEVIRLARLIGQPCQVAAETKYEEALEKLEERCNNIEDEGLGNKSFRALEMAGMHARSYARLMGEGQMVEAQRHMQDLWKILVPDLCK